jgi:hypothetical protein
LVRGRYRRAVSRVLHSLLVVTFAVGVLVPSGYADSRSQEEVKFSSDLLDSLLQNGQPIGSPPPQSVSHSVTLGQMEEQVHVESAIDELIIQFKEDASEEQRAQTIAEVKGTVIVETDRKMLIKIPPTSSWQDRVKELQSKPWVQFAEPNRKLKTQTKSTETHPKSDQTQSELTEPQPDSTEPQPDSTEPQPDSTEQQTKSTELPTETNIELTEPTSAPNDPGFPSQWGLQAIEAESAWETIHGITLGANPPVQPSPVVIAVIDSGVDQDHPDLEGRLLPGFSTITGADETNYADTSGHGTHVAGVIAALSDNELGGSGAAGVYPVHLLPIKAFNEDNEGTIFDVTNAINRAAQWVGPNGEKVKVINLTFGFQDWIFEEGFTLEDAIRNAQSEGIVIVAAAAKASQPMNGADPIDVYLTNHFSGVISVGAVDENFQPIDDINQSATILAPGANIYSTLPNGGYGVQSGSSMATSFVSAAISLLLMVNPQITQPQLEFVLQEGSVNRHKWSMHRTIVAGLPGSDSNPPNWSDTSELTANVEVDRVSLQWSGVVWKKGGIRYKVYQDGVPLPGEPSSPRTVTGLTPETEYTFKVEAIDIWGNESKNGPSITVRTHSIGESFEMITTSPSGQPADGDSYSSSASEDGRFVVYSSRATNLVDGDTNGFSDIFIYDRQKNETKRINLAANDQQANGESFAPIMSLDGGYILFISRATNLTTMEDQNGKDDLFLYDRKSGKIERVVEDVSATTIRNAKPYAISASGQYLAYASRDTHGDPKDLNGTWDVFLKDRWNHTTKRLTNRSSQHWAELATEIAMTPDGRYIAYSTEDAKGILNVYLYDRQKDITEEVSVSLAEKTPNEKSYSPSISADGQYVAFSSYSNKLVANDSIANYDIFVRDRTEQKTEIVSKTITGGPSDATNDSPWISGDGRYVVFHSYDALDPRAYNAAQIYIHDRHIHQTELVSKSIYQQPGGDDSRAPFITPDGRFAIFESRAKNLTEDELENRVSHIYMKEIHPTDRPTPEWDATAKLTATQIGAHYVHLNWDGSEQGAYYKIFDGDQLIDIVQGHSYLYKNLTPATTYQLRIQMGDKNLNWGDSLQLDVTTLSTRETTAPGPILEPVFEPAFGKLAMSWKAPADSDYIGTKVMWRKKGSSVYRELPMIPKGVEKAEILGLLNSTLYEIVFVSMDGDGNETETPVYSVRTPNGPQTSRVSITNDLQDAFGFSYDPDVSDDGRYVVFASYAANLADKNRIQYSDIFLYDRVTERLQLITRASDGQFANESSHRPKISGDGRFIVFQSYAKNLTATADPDNHADIFLYDRDSDGDGRFDEPGETTMKEITAAGLAGDSLQAVINADGSVIAFESTAKSLVSKDTSTKNVYLYHRDVNKISLLELADGTVPNQSSSSPSISADGEYIAFATAASNLDASDTNESFDIYLYQVSTKDVSRVSAFLNEGLRRTEALWPSISEDGRYIAFQYKNHDTDLDHLIYVHDRNQPNPATANRVVSVTLTGEPADGSTFPSISGNGRYVAYQSSSNSIVEQDQNEMEDIFMYEMSSGSSVRVSSAFNGLDANNRSEKAVVNGDGSTVVFASVATNLISDEYYLNGSQDIFVSTIPIKTVPTWPDGSQVSVIDKGETYITLSWTPADDSQGVAQYKIQYGNNQSVLVPGTTTTFKIEGLEPGKTYAFSIQAANASELWTVDGPGVEASTLEETNLADLTLETQSNRRMKVSWERPEPGSMIKGFEIYRKTGDEPAKLVGTIDDATVNTFVDTVNYLTSYTYYVMSIDEAGETKRYSLEKSITSAGITLNSIRYTTPLSSQRNAIIGSTLHIVAVGDYELNLQAVIHYENTNGASQESRVNLTETTPGNYVGNLVIPEQAAQIKSIQAVASQNGVEAEITGSQNPLFVGGNITFEIKAESGQLPAGSYLSVSSPSKKIYTGFEIKVGQTQTLTGLPASDDYQYQIIHPNGVKLEIVNPTKTSVRYGETIKSDIVARIFAFLHGKLTYSDVSIGTKAEVTITSEGKHLFAKTLRINSDEEFLVPVILVGAEVAIEVNPEQSNLWKPVQKIVIQPGDNLFNIEIQKRQVAPLFGRVTNTAGEPVEKATVHALQMVRFKEVSTETVTDKNGMYRLDLLEGEAKVFATVPNVGSSQAVELVIERIKENRANLTFVTPAPGTLELEIFTKKSGEDWKKLSLDSGVLSDLSFKVSHPRRDYKPGGLLSLYSKPGDVVSVCVDGTSMKLPKACSETTMDANNNGKMELRLEQIDTLIKAKLEGGPPLQAYSVDLYQVGGDGKRSYLSTRTFGTDLLLDIYQPGRYQLEISAAEYTASRDFTISAGDQLDLGVISVAGPGIYAGRPGNNVMTLYPEVLPGEYIQIRNHFSNSSMQATMDTQLLLEIPQGTSLVENSVLVNQRPAVATRVKANEFAVDVGTVPSKGTGVVLYHLRVDKETSQTHFSVTQRIQFKHNGAEAEERLGEAFVNVTRVRLEAPSLTASKDLTVTGVAPMDSLVRVYDGDVLLGQTTSTGYGRWEKMIRLTNEEKTSNHFLRAEVVQGDSSWVTDIVPVRFEHDYPEIISVQLGGVTFDPRKGAAVLPLRSGPHIISITFSDDSRVRNVKLKIGSQEAAMAKGKNRTYSVVSPQSSSGQISVTYDVADSFHIYEIPTLEDYQSRTSGLGEFETTSKNVQTSDRDPFYLLANAKGSFQVTGESVGLDVSTSMQTVTYTPTAKDEAWISKTGLPLHDFSYQYQISGDTLIYSITALIPEKQFDEGGMENVLKTFLDGKANGSKVESVAPTVIGVAGQFVKVVLKGTWQLAKNNPEGWEAFTKLKDIAGIDKYNKKRDEIVDLYKRVPISCDPEVARRYLNKVDEIRELFLAVEVAKWGIQVTGVAFGPSTFGAATLVIFGVSEIAGMFMDSQVDSLIDELRKEMYYDPKCDEPRLPSLPGGLLASPIWIHDPSGYVYEVEESNRIEGVTATVMFWDEAESSWKQWDAEWFGQINPQLTDREGKYAWDVPEGKWKVVYSKDGFMTAESDELIVLPPHTDVNIRMISLLPPEKMNLVAAPGGSSIDVIFDRHVMVDAVNDTTIAVVEEGQEEGVQIAAITAVNVVDFNGKQVANRFRITFAGNLVVGKEYTVRAAQGILSYNEVPIRTDMVGKVLIPERDLPPAMVTDVVPFVGLQEIFLSWKDPEDDDLDHMVVSWKKENQPDYVDSLKVSKGEETAVLTSLTENTVYTIKIEAVDVGGNVSKSEHRVSTGTSEPEVDLAPPMGVVRGAVKTEGANLKVTWTDPNANDLSQVVVRWKEADKDEDYLMALVPKGIGSYLITGLKADTTYEITVAALDVAGNESVGWLATMKTAATEIPNHPPPGGGGGNPPPIEPKPEEPKNPGTPTELNPNEAKIVVKEEGGIFRVLGGHFGLKVQPKAFAGGREILVVKNDAPLVGLESGYRPITPVYQLSVDSNVEVMSPMTIGIQYDASALLGADYRKLGIYRQDDVDPKKWTYVGGVVDPSKRMIFTDIKSWGNYAVLVYQHSFTDMKNNWSNPEVEVLVARHFVSGVSPELFGPNQVITRAQFTKLIVQFAQATGIRYPEHKAITFSDVPADAWYLEYLDVAVKFGLVTGSEGRFIPNAPITREQMVTMIYRALNMEGSAEAGQLERFADHNKVGPWAAPAMKYAIQHSIIKGTAENLLKPKDPTTRAQAAVIFLRLMEHAGLVSGESPF